METTRTETPTGAIHSFSDREKAAFVTHLNSIEGLVGDPELAGVLPINPDSLDLFEVVKDGVLFCKFINLIAPGTIPKIHTRKEKNAYEIIENHAECIRAAKALGCYVVNIGPEDLMEGKPHLVLGLLWQLIKLDLLSKVTVTAHPELYRLVGQEEDVANYLQIPPDEVLLRWVNYHLQHAGSARRIANFNTDIRDSEVYTLLLHQLDPHQCTLDPLSEADPLLRAEKMLDNAGKLNCKQFLSPNDVVEGNSRLNLAFVANLFNKHSGLALPTVDDMARLRSDNESLQQRLKEMEEELRKLQTSCTTTQAAAPVGSEGLPPLPPRTTKEYMEKATEMLRAPPPRPEVRYIELPRNEGFFARLGEKLDIGVKKAGAVVGSAASAVKSKVESLTK